MIIEYRLQFLSPLIGSLDSDTLMGALAWSMIRTEGQEALVTWIQKCHEGNPPFVVSNGFPTGYFPKPTLMPVQSKGMDKKSDQLKSAKESKRWKNRHWIPYEEFIQLLKGTPISAEKLQEPSFYSGKHVHAIIDRSTGRSLSEGGLYETTFSGYEYVSIFIHLLDPTWNQMIDRLMQQLEFDGLGARKSTGSGHFRVLSRESIVLPSIKEPNGYIVLSNFVPSSNDATEGRYRIKTKYGKMAEEFSLQGKPLKKPLLMIESGACFYDKAPKMYCGRLIAGIAPQRPEVVQFCYGLTIPTVLPYEGRNFTR